MNRHGVVTLAATLCVAALPAQAQARTFAIPAGTLSTALALFAKQSGRQLVYKADDVRTARSPGARGAMTPDAALQAILSGTGFTVHGDSSGAVAIVRAAALRGVSYAQEAPLQTTASQSVDDQQADASSGQLQDVVVTAQRIEQNLQKTPVAVTALSGADLEAANLRDAAHLSEVTPSLSVGRQGGSNNPAFFIRGVGQDNPNLTFDQGVGLYVDDVYYARSNGANLRLLDVDRVEVRRGPQGTLFGRNSVGGNIAFYSRQPSATLGGYVEGTYGSYDRLDLTGTINVPLTDNLFVKVTGATYNQHGYIRHLADGGRSGGRNSDAGRFQLRWQPTDRLTIDGTFNYLHERDTGPAMTIGAVDLTAPFVAPANAVHAYLGEPQLTQASVIAGDRYAVLGGQPGDRGRNEQIDGNVRVKYDISPDIFLKSITAYVWNKNYNSFDYDASPAVIFNTAGTQRTHSFQQEFQFGGTTIDKSFQWVTGVFYFSEHPYNAGSDGTAYFYANLGPGLGNGRFDFAGGTLDSKVSSVAVYAQASYTLAQKLTLIAGGRYTDEKKEIAVSQPTVFTIFPVPNTPSFAVPIPFGVSSGANRATFSNVSPKVSLQYQWTPAIMTYASATEGFRSGGFNSQVSGSLPQNGLIPYNPETIWNYEAGLRSEFFNRRLRFNATYFYQKYKDLQLTATCFTCTPIATFITNVGREHQSGVELEAQAVATEALHFRAQLSTLSAHYDDLGAANGINGLMVSSPLARAPKYSGSVGLNYVYRLPADGRLTFDANYAFTGSQQSSSSPNNSLLLPAYQLLNLRLTYAPRGRHLSASAFVTNLLDKYYLDSGENFLGQKGQIGVLEQYVAEPREAGVTARVSF